MSEREPIPQSVRDKLLKYIDKDSLHELEYAYVHKWDNAAVYRVYLEFVRSMARKHDEKLLNEIETLLDSPLIAYI